MRRRRYDLVGPDIPYRTLYVGAVGGHGLGKSTMMTNLQQLLEERLPDFYNIQRVSMADKLRDTLNVTAGYYVGRKKRHPLERQALQWAGEAFRAQDVNYWVREYLDPSYCSGPDRNIILTDDVYHVNEAMLMDVLILIGEPAPAPADPDAYEPDSIKQTRMLLEHAHLLHPGIIVRLNPSTPADLSEPAVLEQLALEIAKAEMLRAAKGGDFDHE